LRNLRECTHSITVANGENMVVKYEGDVFGRISYGTSYTRIQLENVLLVEGLLRLLMSLRKFRSNGENTIIVDN
jgi:hypothetical protein